MNAVNAPTSPELAAFSRAFDEFTRAQRRARGRFNRQPATPALSLSQYQLLEPLLARAEPLRVGRLALAVGVSTPTATRMLDGLELRGLVTRVRESDDRRQVCVAITDAGAELVGRKRDSILAARAQVFASLAASERRAAARVLRALAAAIDELHP
jgi:DNA-binding MarR family transcriptional regulator